MYLQYNNTILYLSHIIPNSCSVLLLFLIIVPITVCFHACAQTYSTLFLICSSGAHVNIIINASPPPTPSLLVHFYVCIHVKIVNSHTFIIGPYAIFILTIQFPAPRMSIDNRPKGKSGNSFQCLHCSKLVFFLIHELFTVSDFLEVRNKVDPFNIT